MKPAMLASSLSKSKEEVIAEAEEEAQPLSAHVTTEVTESV